MTRLAALRGVDDSAWLSDGVGAILRERSSYVVASAATLAAERNARGAIPAIVGRFNKLLNDPKADDPSGAAALALVKALVTLEAGYEAEDVALAAARYVRWEAV